MTERRKPAVPIVLPTPFLSKTAKARKRGKGRCTGRQPDAHKRERA